MIKFLKLVCILIIITSGALADTDGNLELSKKNKVSKRRKVNKGNPSFLANIINKIKRK